MRRYTEMVGVVLLVFLEDRPRREVGRIRRQGKIRELVEVLLHLDAEIHIAIGPYATEGHGPLKDRAFETLGKQRLGFGEARNTCPDNPDGSHTREVRGPARIVRQRRDNPIPARPINQKASR